MLNTATKYWPFFICLLILFISFSLEFHHSTSATQGKFIYPLDDTYIHINIAKNLYKHGVWGVSEESFSSSSSSILWPLLISISFFIFGENILTPLILSSITAVFLLFALYKIFGNNGFPHLLSLIALIFILFSTPLLPLIFSGLEHTIHGLAMVLLFYSAVSYLSSSIPRKRPYVLFVLAALGTMIRFETMFIVFILSCLYLIKNEWFHSILIFLSGFFPILIYGLISLSKGWYFLPNPVLLKGRTPDLSSFKKIISWFYSPWKEAYSHPHVLLILFITALMLIYLFLKKRKFFSRPVLFNFLLFLSLAAHVQFAKVGRFYRYEAYLIITALLAFFIFIKEIFFSKEKERETFYVFVPALLFLVLYAVLAIRGVKSISEVPQASQNIFQQQYHMGMFLKKYYSGDRVALNDIGAANYLADIKCLDLWGLSSMKVAEAKREGTYDTDFICKITRMENVKIAILYTRWYSGFGGLPAEWEKAGYWKISNNVVCGDDTVTFYAVSSDEKKDLMGHLKEFSKSLPEGVEYKPFPKLLP